jgi:DNA-binding PucR family transcriptional regulator
MDLQMTITNEDNASKMHIGISENEYGILSLARTFRRANSVLRIAKKQKKTILHYSEIGIYQMIIEIDDMKVLKKIYDDTLGELEIYDQKNNTDYMELLELYLKKNNSVEQVAKETFVHRNTVNYKVKKIKEILNCELNQNEILKLVLAFYIKDYL